MDPLSVSASLVAIFQLAATVNQYLKGVKGGSEEQIRLREEIRSTICLFEILNDRVEDAESSEKYLVSIRSLNIPGGPLEQLRGALDQLVVKLAPAGRLKVLTQAFTWPLTTADVNALLATIERQKVLFGLAMQDDNIGLSREIKCQVEEVNQRITNLQIDQEYNQRRILDQEDRNIITWISPLTFGRKQSDVFSKRTEGTGGWLLESTEFQRWVAGTEKVLWCPDIPGAGKTVLASVVINHLQQTFPSEDFGVAFIYCNYKEQKEQSLNNLLLSLLRQLIDKRSVVPEEMYHLYKRHKEKETRPTLSESLKLLQLVVSQFSTVFIIIDALDECSEGDRTRSSLINNLYQLLPKIRFFCTSRRLGDIESQFKSSPCQEILATDTDIGIYLETRIQQKTRLRKHVKTDSTLLALITDKIVSVADGMFLLAQLHIESIATKSNRKAIRSTLASLPTALDETYEEVLRRIYGQNKDDVLLAEKVLSWISFSVRPLKVPELQHAIAIMDYGEGENVDDEDLPDEDILVTVCWNYAQECIAVACLSYLSQDVFQEGPCVDKASLKTRFQRHPLLHYAAQNWGNHVRGPPEQSCRDSILEFLNNKCLTACASQATNLDPNLPRSRGFPSVIPSLVNASLFGLSETVAFLICSGNDVEETDDSGVSPLIAAAKCGQGTVIRQLLAAGAQIEARTLYKSTALIEAAQYGHQQTVKLLLEEGADLEATDLGGCTALHNASRNGHNAVIDVLLSHGANVEREDLDNRRALSLAVFRGHTAAAELLIEAASMNGKDAGLDEAFYHAIPYSGVDLIKLLIDKGASLIDKIEDIHGTRLHVAALFGKLEVVKLLIDYRLSPMIRNSYDSTPLHEASINGRTEVVELLLEKGAEIDAQTRTGHTPIYWAIEGAKRSEACEEKAKEVVTLLLKGGADVNKRSSNGETVLHLSARNGLSAITEILLESGADLEAKDHMNWTALQVAAACNEKAVVERLLAYQARREDSFPEVLLTGAQLRIAATQGDQDAVQQLLKRGTVFVPDANGRSALHEAAYHGHNKIVEMLLETEMDINATTLCPLKSQGLLDSSKGITALHFAASQGHAETMSILIRRNAHINARTWHGDTPLSLAAEFGHLKCVELLLEHKANVIVADDRHNPTPLLKAASRGHTAIVRLLLANGADIEAQSDTGSQILTIAIHRLYLDIVRLLQEHGFKLNII